ncbi:MAG: hypothetical protein QM726_13615 [Chitinophagaceae bacterium]
MKRLLVIVVAVFLTMGASAQRFGHGFGGGRVYAAPRVSVGIGYSPFFYSPYGYYPYGYGYPGGAYARSYRPSKLQMKIEDIKADYKDKIYSAKHDTSLTGKERRQTVRQLKHERDQAIDDLKRNYYKN